MDKFASYAEILHFSGAKIMQLSTASKFLLTFFHKKMIFMEKCMFFCINMTFCFI